jgi:hypothetical protein
VRAFICLALLVIGELPAGASGRMASDVRLFEAHSGFWLNLHHVLYEQARLRRVARGEKSRGPTFELAPDVGTLSEVDRASWNAALAYYESAVVGRDLLFDEELYRVKGVLARSEDDVSLDERPLPAALKTALARTAPIYRKTAWAAHDRANRRTWPTAPVRVDLVAVANWSGGYTSIHPQVHIVLSSLEPSNQATSGLEILFHEASHGLVAHLRSELERAAEGADIGDLWHVVLFYTVGEIVKRHFGSYVPYAETQHLYEGRWQIYRQAIERAWKPYLDGNVNFEAATTALVGALRKP